MKQKIVKNTIKKLFGKKTIIEERMQENDSLTSPFEERVIEPLIVKSLRLDENTDIGKYCQANKIELNVGSENSKYDFRARMKSEAEKEFSIETITKKGPYLIGSPYLGDGVVDCDTIVTFPGKARVYAMGGNTHIDTGYAFVNGDHLASGEMCTGSKLWLNFSMSKQNRHLDEDIIKKYEPAINLLEYLTGRKLINKYRSEEEKK